MAITRLEKPLKMRSKEVDYQYDGRWVLFLEHDINEPGLVCAYSDHYKDSDGEEHFNDHNRLEDILIEEFKGKGIITHACKMRGEQNIHVEYIED